MARKPTLHLDLDEMIRPGDRDLNEPPVDGSVAALRRHLAHHTVVIHWSRFDDPVQRQSLFEAVAEWFGAHGIDDVAFACMDDWDESFEPMENEIILCTVKPAAALRHAGDVVVRRYAMSVAFKVGWTLVAFTLSALRLHGVMDNRYQALVHLVEGAWLATWSAGLMVKRRFGVDPDYNYYGWLALACGIVEVCAFCWGIGRIDGR